MGNVDNLFIERVLTSYSMHGIAIDLCTNVIIRDSVAEFHRGFSVAPAPVATNNTYRIATCHNVIIEDCQFSNNSSPSPDNGLSSQGLILRNSGGFGFPLVDLPSTNIRISGCNLYNSGIFVLKADDVIIENITSLVDDPNNTTNFINLGGGVTSFDGIARDVIIRNCTLQNQSNPTAAGFDGILLVRTTNVLIEDVVINANPAAFPGPPPFLPALVHIGAFSESGDPSFIATDITVRNVRVSGASALPLSTIPPSGNATVGFYCDGPTGTTGVVGNSNILIENCEATECSDSGIRIEGTTASVVQNCKVLSNLGDGIKILTSHGQNVIQGNVVSSNGGIGINDLSGPGSNVVADNLSSFNTGGNYAGVSVVLPPGSPAVISGNLSFP